jgi:arsenate reductase (glutaredoxin)
MAKTFYYLSTCNTCQRIMDELDLPDDVERREIKSQPLTEAEVDHLQTLAGAYEHLFSRRARKFRQWGLHERSLDEAAYRHYLLEDYTFLKRPVLVVEDRIFIGNAKQVVAEAKAALT